MGFWNSAWNATKATGIGAFGAAKAAGGVGYRAGSRAVTTAPGFLKSMQGLGATGYDWFLGGRREFYAETPRWATSAIRNRRNLVAPKGVISNSGANKVLNQVGKLAHEVLLSSSIAEKDGKQILRKPGMIKGALINKHIRGKFFPEWSGIHIQMGELGNGWERAEWGSLNTQQKLFAGGLAGNADSPTNIMVKRDKGIIQSIAATHNKGGVDIHLVSNRANLKEITFNKTARGRIYAGAAAIAGVSTIGTVMRHQNPSIPVTDMTERRDYGASGEMGLNLYYSQK